MKVESRVSEGRFARRRVGWFGLGYIVLVLAFTFNGVLDAWGGPSVRTLLFSEDALPGTVGLELLAWLGVLVAALALWRRGLSGLQWKLVLAVTVWIGATALSMALHGVLRDGRFWSVTVIALGIATAGALVGPDLMRRGVFALGWFYGWGSVAAGVSDLLFGWPTVLILDSPRYGRWLEMLGVGAGDVPSLNGVTPGRVYLGLNCAILLVYAVRTLLGRSTGWRSWVMPFGLVLAIAWSFSRTGLVAAGLGLVVALFPFERFRQTRVVAGTFAAALVVVMLPLALSSILLRSPITDGTTVWRFNLWQDYLATSGIWLPFGLGPRAASPQWADHAHQQVLEALAVGGWFGVAGFLAFLAIACVIAIRASRWDGRATVGVVFAAAAMFQVDVLTYSANYWTVNNALVLLLAILASSAGVRKGSQLIGNGISGASREPEIAAAATTLT